MKKNKAIQLAASTLIVAFSLLAIGCGGSSSSSSLAAPVLNLNQNGNSSIGKVASFGTLSNSLATASISTATVSLMSIDGQVLQTQEIENFSLNGGSISLNSMTQTSAGEQGLIVVKVNEKGNENNEFITVTRLNAAALARGAATQDTADTGSTVVAKIFEAQISSATGKKFSLGEKLAPKSAAAKLLRQTGDKNKASRSIAMPEFLDALDTASANTTAGSSSVIAQIIAAAASEINTSSNKSISNLVGDFLTKSKGASAAVTAQLKSLKKIAKVAANISTLAANSSNSNIVEHAKDLLNVANAGDAAAKKKIAGAQMIKNLIAVQGAQNASNQALKTKIDALDFSDLDAIADEARTEIIATLDASTATNLQEEGLLDEMVGAIGDTLLDSEDATERSSALATLKTILNVAGNSKSKNELLGSVLAATSEDEDALGEVLTGLANVNGLSIKEAIKTIATDEDADAEVADISLAIVETLDSVNSEQIKKLFGSSGAPTAASFINDLKTVQLGGESLLDGDDLEFIDNGSEYDAQDEAYLFGPDQALNDDFVFFGNDSVESTESVTFTYYWTIEVGGNSYSLTDGTTSIPGLTEVEVEDDGAGFEASTGNYVIKLEQMVSTVPATRTTASQVLSVVADENSIVPELFAELDSLIVSPGATETVFFDYIDPNERDATFTASGCSNSVSDLTVDDSYELEEGFVSVTFTVTATTATACEISIAANYGGAAVEAASFSIEVEPLNDTELFVDELEVVGTTIDFTALVIQEQALTSGVFAAYVSTSESVLGTALATATISEGVTELSTSKTGLETGLNYLTLVATIDSTVTSESIPFYVQPAGAPVINDIQGVDIDENGQVVEAFSVLDIEQIFTIVNGQSESLDFNVIATSTGDSAISFYRASLFSTSSTTPDASVTNSNGEFRNFGTISGTSDFGLFLEVVDSDGAVGAYLLFIETENVTEVEVTDVNLAGSVVSSGSLTYTALPGVFEIDASNVEGLTLDTNQSLEFNIMTAGTSAAAELDIELQLTDPESSRHAALKSLNVSLQSGYDIALNNHSLLIFSGEKESGTLANVETTGIANFDAIFSAANGGGLSIDIIQLKNSLVDALGDHSFAGSISSLEGEDLTLTVTIESANDEIFEFSSGDELFNTFVIHGINVGN